MFHLIRITLAKQQGQNRFILFHHIHSYAPEVFSQNTVENEPDISPDLPANYKSELSNNEVNNQSETYPPGYIPREEREKRLRRWAIDHNEDPDKFVTITDKDKTDSIDYLTRIDVDANTCLFNIEQGNDPHDFMEMTHRERLIGEEILRRRLEDAGESIWLDTDEEWIKNKTILQENGLLW
ncbi:2570_t:CDS:2 [Paraglomus brasilianum]|uniref:2570_t:CDS:1 n=1 Tax=Paraglomus brasilianum TaxID=144538 RepID=A0A9N8ZAV6_9GLOM|nr:2570_t:CDS:2 [Paraglomus brasilianum]